MARTKRKNALTGANYGSPALRRKSGFTLIEVLITVSLFTLLMTTLLSSVYYGVKAWGKVDGYIVESTHARIVLDEVKWALEHLYFEPELEQPVLEYTTQESGSSTLQFLTTDLFLDHSEIHTIYNVALFVKEQEDQTNWIQTIQSMVHNELTGTKEETVLLHNITSVKYEFLQNGQWTPQYDAQQGIPNSIKISLLISEPSPITIQDTVVLTGGSLE